MRRSAHVMWVAFFYNGNMAEPIKILIVDDYAVVRAGLRALIELESDMVVVGEAHGGITAVSQIQALLPDVVIMDLVMPEGDGLTAVHTIRQEKLPTRILILTDFNDEDHIMSAMSENVDGYLLKDAASDGVIDAIRSVYRGKIVLHPAIAQIVLFAAEKTIHQQKTTPRTLTPRETDVLRLVAKGFTNQTIGENLGIDERTVRLHVTHILHKLQLENRTQAALYALRHGLATLR